jgi:hypothetical protein
MKEIFCVAVFAGKLLGLVVFVSALRPDSVGVVQASLRPAQCKIELSRMQGCGPSAIAAASEVDVGACSVRQSATHC